jgi:uncharacterized membrane protein
MTRQAGRQTHVIHLAARHRTTVRTRWRVAFAVAMAVAGLSHLIDPIPFVQHLPTWVPQRELLVLATGLAEMILGAALVLRQPYRRIAGVALAGHLVAVFPANVYVAVAGIEVDGQPGGLYPWLRLPWQVLYVWLAVWSTRPSAREGSSESPTADFRSDEVVRA